MKNKTIALRLLGAEYGKNVRFAENYGNIDELAYSILEKGVLQPLIVEDSEKCFNILSGHRRYAALNLLLEQGKIDSDYKVPCIVQTCANDIERTAIKLLANDGQPLTPYEWAAEVVSLSDAGYTGVEIAKALGKSEVYVSQLRKTWAGLSPEAQKQVVNGKVSMSLAIAISKESPNDKISSIAVSLSAAAKDLLDERKEKVSDKVLSAAVIDTVNEVVSAASNGVSMSSDAIGSAVLANIVKVKAKSEKAREVSKAVMEGASALPDFKNWLDGLIEGLRSDKECGVAGALIDELLFCYEQGFEIEAVIGNLKGVLNNKTK